MAQVAVDVFETGWVRRTDSGGVACGVACGDAYNDAASSVPWQRAHEELVRLAKKHAGLDFEEGRWLLAALRSGAHLRLGYGSFNEYTERLFGYGARVTQEKLRVAEALSALPETARELEAGRISFSAVRELTRVAIAATERDWLEASSGRTVREIEQLVAGQRPGSRPDDARDPSAKRHVLRLEVSGEVLATFREAMAKLRRDAGEALDDDAAVLLLARSVLQGPRDEGRASYQVALTLCEECGRGRQQGAGELVEVTPEVVGMADCDGQRIGRVDVGAHVGAQSALHSPSPTGAHVGAQGAQRSPNRTRAHAGAQGALHSPSPTRATQSVPPALRRAVLRRDGGRCRAPGCRHATFVDVHHLVPRADGGKNMLENLVTLCSSHHRRIHRGELVLEGTPPTGLRFLHADGTAYGGLPSPAGSAVESRLGARAPAAARGLGDGIACGASPSPAVTEARAKACRALSLMGYGESETQRALARIPGSCEATLEQLIRQGLRELALRSR